MRLIHDNQPVAVRITTTAVTATTLLLVPTARRQQPSWKASLAAAGGIA